MTDEDGKQGARLRLHRLWAPIIVMAVVLAVAGVTPAGAQSTETVRVNNLEAAETSQISLGEGQQYGQSFCTGPFAVALTKVRLATRSTSGPNPAPSVTIRADRSGEPGQSVDTLSNPTTFDGDISTNEDFTSSGVTLEANARYWLVLSVQDSLVFGVTGSRHELSAAGWSMGDKMFYRGNAGWRPAFVSAKRPNGYRMRMAVYASGDTPSITQPVFPCIDTAAPLTMEVNENADAGAVVGQTSAADPDYDSVTYSVSGADAAGFNQVFAINASTGEITVKSGASPNYEVKRSYSITVNVTDGEDASGNAESPALTDDSVSATIRVKNIDEAGIITLIPPTPAVGSVLNAVLTDPDGELRIIWVRWHKADTATGPFTLIGGNNSRCSSQGCYAPAAADQGKFLKVSITYYDGASGPRNASGNLIILSSNPTRDRRTIEVTSSNPVAIGGL